jgi:HSP20 family molecular chaperone IbpA
MADSAFDHPVEADHETESAATSRGPVSQGTASSGAVRAIEATILTVDGTWTLLADLPGVDADGIDLSDTGRGGQLILAAEGRQRRYAGRFDLPDGLGADDLAVSLVNGILELRAEVPFR